VAAIANWFGAHDRTSLVAKAVDELDVKARPRKLNAITIDAGT
jgi:hypothetical protein